MSSLISLIMSLAHELAALDPPGLKAPSPRAVKSNPPKVPSLTLICSQTRTPKTHRLEATPDTVVYGYYWSEAKPALRIASGDIIDVDTLLFGQRSLPRTRRWRTGCAT